MLSEEQLAHAKAQGQECVVLPLALLWAHLMTPLDLHSLCLFLLIGRFPPWNRPAEIPSTVQRSGLRCHVLPLSCGGGSYSQSGMDRTWSSKLGSKRNWAMNCVFLGSPLTPTKPRFPHL